ncbi:hypothetical protein ACJ72_05908 [Emergomyces africanus]|uniref:Uncharacterized protein n=1 Tax=Emergomyces africanus TaxID=1955775 RepID=A0A1B7NSF5_9EURO|nr:hypothetical protein ACJ72_05953 [Emergomyces africanus]OAX79767.1 hypothetical protein ACJ72_05908 [Emergomyces africanus]
MANDPDARTYGDAAEELILPSQLEEARIITIPESAYYIPMFISQEEEERLLQKVCYSIQP